MRRCATPQMSLLPAKCSGGLTVPKINTSTTRATAGQKFFTHTGPETGMEVRCDSYLVKATLAGVRIQNSVQV